MRLGTARKCLAIYELQKLPRSRLISKGEAEEVGMKVTVDDAKRDMDGFGG